MADASPGPLNPSAQYLAAAALFVIELTRTRPLWAEWKETDLASVRWEYSRISHFASCNCRLFFWQTLNANTSRGLMLMLWAA